MPSNRASSSKSASKSASKPSKPEAAYATPKRFNFKKIKRDKKSKSGSSSSGSARRTESKATTTRIHEAVYQSGDKEGEPTGAKLFVFNPRYGLNHRMTEAVENYKMGKDAVGNFSKELRGFYIKVHTPKQAESMHNALRELDPDMAEHIELGQFTSGPEVCVITFSNLDLPETEQSNEQTGVTAIMLEGYTYPLYKKLRGLGYDFFRGVHDKEGINRWVRVVKGKESAAKLVKEVSELLDEQGWEVETAEADANDWDDDGDESDEEER